MALVLLHGCAVVNVTPPSEKTIERSKVYSQNFEESWSRSVDWFADNNVAIEKIEKDSGLLTAKYLLRANDTVLDCGKVNTQGVINNSINKYGSLNLTVRKIGAESSKVNVNYFGRFELSGWDFWWGGNVSAKGNCSSTGELERSVLSYIER